MKTLVTVVIRTFILQLESSRCELDLKNEDHLRLANDRGRLDGGGRLIRLEKQKQKNNGTLEMVLL